MSGYRITYFLLWFIYFAVFIGRKSGYYLPNFFNSYLTDLLCVPLVMFLTQWIIQKVKRNPSIRLSAWHTLFVVVYVSVVFEWWLPSKNSIYTADVWDVICYVNGGIGFWVMNKKHTLQLKLVKF